MELWLTLVSPVRIRLLATGVLGFAAQVVLMRELMTSFAGNELTVGVVVAVWILFESLGALAAARVPDERAAALVIPLGLGAALASVAAVVAPVLARPVLGLVIAETFSLPQVLLVSAAAAILPAGLHGALFVACAATLGREEAGLSCSRNSGGTSSATPGRAYTIEGLGTGLAGLVVALVLVSRVPGLALVAGAAVLLAVAVVLGQWRPVCVAPGIMTAIACGAVALAANRIERLTWAVAWPSQEVTAVNESPYGKIVSLRRGEQRVVLYDGAPVVSVPPADPAAIEELVGFGLLAHENPRKVLMVGMGLGGYVAQALKYRVAELTVVQLDPLLTSAALAAGESLVRSELNDARVRYVHADPVRFMATDRGQYDCIIQLDVQPANLAASRLFTVEFFRLCQQRLAPDGSFVVAGPGEAARLAPELARVLRLRFKTMAAAFASVQLLAADAPLIFGSNRPLDMTPETLVQRLRQAEVENMVLDERYLAALLSDFRSAMLARELTPDSGGSKLSSALTPSELFLGMVRQNRLAWPSIGRWYAGIGQVSPMWLLMPLVGLLFVGLAGAHLGRAGFRHGFALFLSGMAGAAIVTMTVFGFQVRHGSAYSGVAMVMAAFMLGSVGGAWLGGRLGRRGTTHAFVAVEPVLVFCCVAQPVLIRTGSALSFGLIALLAAGCLGLQFAIAGAAQPGTAAARTGMLTGLDLAGGFWGGLLTSLFLLPVYGVLLTSAIIGGAKLTSLVAQVVPSRRIRA